MFGYSITPAKCDVSAHALLQLLLIVVIIELLTGGLRHRRAEIPTRRDMVTQK